MYLFFRCLVAVMKITVAQRWINNGERTFRGVTISQGVFYTVCKMLQIIRDQQGHRHTDVIDCETLLSEMQTAFDNGELNMSEQLLNGTSTHIRLFSAIH